MKPCTLPATSCLRHCQPGVGPSTRLAPQLASTAGGLPAILSEAITTQLPSIRSAAQHSREVVRSVVGNIGHLHTAVKAPCSHRRTLMTLQAALAHEGDSPPPPSLAQGYGPACCITCSPTRAGRESRFPHTTRVSGRCAGLASHRHQGQM